VAAQTPALESAAGRCDASGLDEETVNCADGVSEGGASVVEELEANCTEASSMNTASVDACCSFWSSGTVQRVLAADRM
jgi:hypothetical protein